MTDNYRQAPMLVHRGSKTRFGNRNYYELPQELMRAVFNRLSGKQGNLLKLITVLMGTAGNYKFKVSQKWITDLTGMDESGYKRARKALAEMGWISHENNHIYVDFDKIWDDALANTMRGLAVTEDTNNAKMAQTKQGSNTAPHDAAPRFVKNTPNASDSTKGSSNPSGGAMKNPIINNNKEEQIINNKESFAEGVKGPRKIISHYRKPNERKVELLDINDYLEDP